jgi:hypothetical protein
VGDGRAVSWDPVIGQRVWGVVVTMDKAIARAFALVRAGAGGRFGLAGSLGCPAPSGLKLHPPDGLEFTMDSSLSKIAISNERCSFDVLPLFPLEKRVPPFDGEIEAVDERV